MSVENSEWIMRGLDWDNPYRIKTWQQLVNWINEMGFLPLFGNYEKYGRDNVTKKRYGRTWKRIRDKYASEHPFCELCFDRGIIVETEEIHHKKSLSEDGTHRYMQREETTG